MAQLFVLSGADVGRSFDIRGGDTLGRSQDCILVLRDPSISRRHAHLEEVAGRWSVVDDGSRNGIISGGVKSRRVELSDGHEFLLGEVLLRFRCEPSAQGSAAEPAPAAPPAPTPPSRPTQPAPPGAGPASRRPSAAPVPAETGEVVLEGADEIDLAASARPAPSSARAGPREGLAEQRGRILQYHRVAETGSPLASELSQLPGWKRYGLYLLGLLLLAGAAAAAFLGAAFVKGRLAGAADAPQVDGREPGGR